MLTTIKAIKLYYYITFKCFHINRRTEYFRSHWCTVEYESRSWVSTLQIRSGHLLIRSTHFTACLIMFPSNINKEMGTTATLTPFRINYIYHSAYPVSGCCPYPISARDKSWLRSWNTVASAAVNFWTFFRFTSCRWFWYGFAKVPGFINKRFSSCTDAHTTEPRKSLSVISTASDVLRLK